MTLYTVTYVADSFRMYESNGPKAAFKVKLDPDIEGEVRTTQEAVRKRMDEFKAMIGKPTELVVEDGGTWDDGNPKPKRVKKPSKDGQTFKDSGGGKKGDWESAAERAVRRQMEADKDASIIAEVAMKHAANMAMKAFAPEEQDNTLILRGELFDAMVECVLEATPKLAAKIREASEPRTVPQPQMSDSGSSADAGVASRATPEAGPAPVTSPGAVAPDSPGSDLPAARNAAIAKFGKPSKVEEVAGKPFAQLTAEELVAL